MNERTAYKTPTPSEYISDPARSARRLFAYILGAGRFKNSKVVLLDDGHASRQAQCQQSELPAIQRRLIAAGLLLIKQGRRGASYQLYSLFDDSRYFTKKIEEVEPFCIV